MSAHISGIPASVSGRVQGVCITKDGFVKVKDILGQVYEVTQRRYIDQGYQPDLSELPLE